MAMYFKPELSRQVMVRLRAITDSIDETRCCHFRPVEPKEDRNTAD